MPRTKSPLGRIGKVVAIATAVFFTLAAIAVLRTGLVPLRYMAIILPISLVGIGVITLGQFSKKASNARRIVLLVISLLVLFVSAYIYSSAQSLTAFLSNIQQSAYTYETYSIIAEKSRHMSLTSAKSAAMLSTDTYLNEAKEGLKTKTAAAPQDYSNTTSIILALEQNDADTAVLSDGYMQLVEDNYAKFYSDIEVLATFQIRIKHDKESTDVDATKPFVVYISGIDTYGSVSTVSRSDVNMLAVVNPTTHQMLLVNTPRDYYVQLHGTSGTRDKLTHAGTYGIGMSRRTLEDLYHTKIDYYLRINFSSLVNIVDTLGGVDVYSDYDFKSFTKGRNHLNGKQALAFSRERYSFSEGDRQRGRNQQHVIEAIIAKMSDPQNLLRYRSILTSLQGAIQTDMSTPLLTQLANNQLDNMKQWSIESIDVDGTGKMAPTYSMGSLPLYVMVPDQKSLTSAQEKITLYLAE